MTCAKAYVKATLTCLDGRVYAGDNSCQRPQPVCPRAHGEDYTKCITVCGQVMHAEVAAILAAIEGGSEPRGGHMRVAYTKVCESCKMTMAKWRITWEHEQKPAQD